METPSTAIKPKRKRTPWYEMLTAPPLADLQRQTRIRNSKNMPTAPEDEPSPLEPRRLDDDAVSTAADQHDNSRQLRPRLSITTGTTAEEEEEEEEEEVVEEEEEEEEEVVDVLEDDDEDDENNDNTFIAPMNVILSVSSIRTALEGNLCCPRCRKTVMQVKDPTEGLGFAGSIDIYCKYCNKDTLNIGMGDQVRKPQEQQQEQPPNKKKKKKKTFIDYAINYKAILLMQQMGQSLQGLEMMLAYFGIAAGRGSYGKWKLIQDYVGEAEESICKEVMNENIEEEIRLVKNRAKEQYGHWHSTEEGRTSPQESKVSKMQEYLHWKDNRIGVSVGSDGAWHKRSIGRGTYNSNTGHNFAVGGLSEKILSTVVYSKMCKMCFNAEKKGVQALPHRCSKNFAGDQSSKSMEGQAAVQHCLNIGTQPTGVYVHTLVTDDDSTVRANTKHSYKAIAQRDYPGYTRKADTDWPYYMDNSKDPPKPMFLKDKGLLPLHCPAVNEWLSDIGHRVKCIGGAAFAMEAKSKKALEAGTHLSKGECLKLKKYAGYFLKTPQNQNLPFDVFCKRAPCMYLHHFDDHSCCNVAWCKVLKSERIFDPIPLPANYTKRFRSKVKHPVLFKKVEEAMAPYLTTEALKQVYHEYSTQKNESLNRKVTVVAPKDKFFGNTRTLQDRVHWVVIEDSIGYCHGIQKVCQKIGISFDSMVREQSRRKDCRLSKLSVHRKKSSVKAKRSAKQYEAIKASNNQDKAAFNAGISYGSGIALLDDLIEAAEEHKAPEADEVKERSL